MSGGSEVVRRITKVLLIAFVLYLLISEWFNIPDKLFSVIDNLKNYLPNDWLWRDTIVDVAKYLLDKIGWAVILFIIQKKYEKHQSPCPPIRCKLLSIRPVKYDSQLHQVYSNKKLELGFGRYYYHFVLQFDAEKNNYFNLSIKGLGVNKLKFDSIKDNETVVADLVVYYIFEKVIWILPISITIRFCDAHNTKYKERLVLIRKNGMYSCNIKTPRKI